jgi:tetratricopeptide (TPR) repeat protein
MKQWQATVLIAVILICLPILPINPIKLICHDREQPKPKVVAAYVGDLTVENYVKDKEAVDFLKLKSKQREQMTLGSKYMQEKRYSLAAKTFKEAVMMDPQLALAHQQLGLTAALSNDYGTAIRELKLALKLNPQDAIAHNNLGLALEHAGKIKEAEPEFEKAAELAPNIASAHYGLGVTLSSEGQYKRAASEFERAQVLDWKIPDGYRRAEECLKKAHKLSISPTGSQANVIIR